MPKMKPDRDDRRGSMAGQGGPQDGPIGNASDPHQQQGDTSPERTGAIGGGEQGEGGQRHPGGSSSPSKIERP
jgi:hypothetical protein